MLDSFVIESSTDCRQCLWHMRDLCDAPNANILRAFPARDDGKWSAKLSICYAGHIQANLNSSRSRKGGVAELQSRCWGQCVRRLCVFDDVEDSDKAEQPNERGAICFAKNIYCFIFVIIIIMAIPIFRLLLLFARLGKCLQNDFLQRLELVKLRAI